MRTLVGYAILAMPKAGTTIKELCYDTEGPQAFSDSQCTLFQETDKAEEVLKELEPEWPDQWLTVEPLWAGN